MTYLRDPPPPLLESVSIKSDAHAHPLTQKLSIAYCTEC